MKTLHVKCKTLSRCYESRDFLSNHKTFRFHDTDTIYFISKRHAEIASKLPKSIINSKIIPTYNGLPPFRVFERGTK